MPMRIFIVTGSVGDYRAGDEIWCERLDPADYGKALNCDVLVPRPAGRFLFGRLIGREEGKLHLLPPGAGGGGRAGGRSIPRRQSRLQDCSSGSRRIAWLRDVSTHRLGPDPARDA